MANCIYCRKSAGFLIWRHSECEEIANKKKKILDEAKIKIIDESTKAIKGKTSLKDLEAVIKENETSSGLPSSELQVCLSKAWERAADKFLEDGVLKECEQMRLLEFQKHFSLSVELLNKNQAYTRIAKAAVLREVCQGKIPDYFSDCLTLPVNLQKNEKVVWQFSDSKYF